jgi:hypothetical protein
MIMVVQLKEILDKILEGNQGIPRASRELKISSAWGKVNLSGVAQNSSPDKLVGGVLYINAKNSAWAQQINLLKPEIILKLNTLIGEQAIKDIRLKTGFTGEIVKRTQEKPKNVCRGCGVEYFGEDGLCPTCLRQTKKEKEIQLIRLVESNPKIKLEQANSLIEGITAVELHRAKRDVTARKADRDFRERRKRGR